MLLAYNGLIHTCSMSMAVNKCCHLRLHSNPGNCLKILIQTAISPVCITCMCHLHVSPACVTRIYVEAGTPCSLWHPKAPPSTSTACLPLPRGLLLLACQSCQSCSSTPPFASTLAGALCTQRGTSSGCSTSSKTTWKWRSCLSTTLQQVWNIYKAFACMHEAQVPVLVHYHFPMHKRV